MPTSAPRSSTRNPTPTRSNITLDFAERMRAAYGLDLRDLSPGGGGGVRYTLDDDPPDPADNRSGHHVDAAGPRAGPPTPVARRTRTLHRGAQRGRALRPSAPSSTSPACAPTSPSMGGWPTNPRPALYQSNYAALLANRHGDGPPESVTLAGRYCESGDVLLRDVALPPLRRGESHRCAPHPARITSAWPANYNMVGRPAVVMVVDGQARLTRPARNRRRPAGGFSLVSARASGCESGRAGERGHRGLFLIHRFPVTGGHGATIPT